MQEDKDSQGGSAPLIMGIVNLTPDSFYQQSRCPSLEKAVALGKKMVEEGADWLDIGGESTRPGAKPVDEEEEIKRVVPVIEALKGLAPLSIDTRHVAVAKAAVEAGAMMINDVSGFGNPAMRRLAAESGVSICVMHMQGEPQTMQAAPHYPQGVLEELKSFFEERVALLEEEGVAREKIVLDPGIGFGKSVAHNVKILHNIPQLKALGYPLLLGVSRKSFMKKILQIKTSELLSTTIAVNTMAILAGIDFIRVHDVKEHRHIVDLLSYMAIRPT